MLDRSRLSREEDRKTTANLSHSSTKVVSRRRTVLRSLFLVTLGLLVTTASAPLATAEPAPVDVAPGFIWAISPGVISNGMGGIELHTAGDNWTKAFSGSLPLEPNQQPLLAVTLNGCGNPAWTAVRFVVDGSPVSSTADSRCRAKAMVAEGRHEVRMTVEGGTAAGTTTRFINVVHHVIVGMGDSLGSGEGLEPPGSWSDQNCHRSAASPQALAAKALEDYDEHSAVTFIFVACSRASVNNGLLWPQTDPPGGVEVQDQLSKARGLTTGLRVDRVLLSVGANDIEFEDIVKTCALHDTCPLPKLHDEKQGLLAQLPGLYRSAADWFVRSGLVTSPDQVMLTETPTVGTERDYDGADTLKSPSGTRYCDGALRPPFPSGIADEEFAWASEVVQDGDPTNKSIFRFQRNRIRDVDLLIHALGLNSQIRKGPAGFTPIVGAAQLFDGRGYCSPDDIRYIVQVDDPPVLGHPGGLASNRTQVFHPNPAGQAAWGRLIGDALVASLDDRGWSSEFLLPAGQTARLSGTVLDACNELTYGYTVAGGSFTTLGSKGNGCAYLPQPDSVIGPFPTAVTFVVVLEDSSCFRQKYDSSSGHALVRGSNPYAVGINDAGGFCEFSERVHRPSSPGEGDFSTTVTIGRGPGTDEVLVEDKFDAENGGGGALNYTGFGKWTVIEGTVDLIGNGFHDFCPGQGLCVDLDGSTYDAGVLITRDTFILVPGTYQLSFKLGGSRRGTSETVEVSLGGVFNDAYTRASADPLTTVTQRITVIATEQARLAFRNSGGDKVGAILDDVRLERL